MISIIVTWDIIMLIKLFIGLVMFIIIASLISGLYYLFKDPTDQKRMVKALTWRIGLSLSLFLLLLLAFGLDLIQPHGIS